jgi:hypothetical protein
VNHEDLLGKEVVTVGKGMPKQATLVLACCGLLWDLWQADRHQRTCPSCAGRDYLEIALDVAHLVQAW